jgi:nuclear pore complex protein Nup155
MITSALEAFDDLVEQVHSSGRDVHGTMEERTRAEAYDYALSANDELFLMTLYDWYLETGKSDQLLEVSVHVPP